MTKDAVILSAARSAGGKFGGSLATLSATQVGAQVIQKTILRSGLDAGEIDQTIFANAWQAGVGPNPARIAAVEGGVPIEVPVRGW